jgi:serine/threonine protein kinase/tetratricopeptide (TPR) repeat protein
MIFREHTPDKKKDSSGLPITILPAGHVLRGQYKTEYIGEGGMSVIYKAVAEGRRYIVKEVDGTLGNEVIALNSEKATLERLSHTGIVKVEELFEEEGYFYLVMEYIEGESLQKKIPRSDTVFLSEKVVLDWARQLLDIFEYLHGQNPPIIYRDLKPHNIILDTKGTIKLIDFGIARLYKDKKQEDTIKMGSVMTASPEHYGEGQTDARSDIYTLGATLYYLLANNPPMGHDVFDFPPLREKNPKVSERTAKVIAKAMELSPDARFQTIAEMKEALFGLKTGGETARIPSSLISSEMERKKRRRDKPYAKKEEMALHPEEIKRVSEKELRDGEEIARTKPLSFQKLICPSCSASNLEDSIFCERCGASLKKERPSRVTAPEPDRASLEMSTTKLEHPGGNAEEEHYAKAPAGSQDRLFANKAVPITLALILGIALILFLMAGAIKLLHRHISVKPSGSPTPSVVTISPARSPVMKPTLSSPTATMTTTLSPAATESSSPLPASSHADEVERLMKNGENALKAKDYRGAEQEFRAALSYDFSNPDAYWYIGQCQEGENKKSDALKAYDNYAKTLPREPDRLRHIAALFSNEKKYDKALEFLKQAQKYDDSAEGNLILGKCFIQKGDYDAAIAILRQTLKKKRNDFDTLLLLGDCQKKKGMMKDAIGAYKAAYDLKPGRLPLLYRIALIAEESGDYDTSKHYLKRYIVLENDEARSSAAEKVLARVKVKAMQNIPPAVEHQTDFVPGVTVVGILKFGKSYKAFLEMEGNRHEIVEGDTILSSYYVLSIKENRIVLTRDETYYVIRPL